MKLRNTITAALALSLAVALGFTFCATTMVVAAKLPDQVILFKNVNIFDDRSDELIRDQDVLVVRNKVHRIAEDIPTSGRFEVEVTTGGERKG